MRVIPPAARSVPSEMQILPSRIPSPELKLPQLKLPFKLGGRASQNLVGLDIQPGFVAAVQARVNGSILAERAATLALPADSVRDGEVLDESALSDTLRELFSNSGLSKRVRVGVANQRTVLRTLELPPVTDPKELAAAVNFQAQDQVPMPLNNAVMDFHPLGVVDTPAGPRQRVVLVAAQRDMIERLIKSVRQAGLSVEGVDLSAFALIRSLYRRDPEQTGRVLYLNVDGLTNLAIAEGTVCRFTRVVGSGLEGMASELAERRSIALTDARALLAGVDLTASAPASSQESPPQAPAPEAAPPEGESFEEQTPGEPAPEAEPQSPEQAEQSERDMSYEELAALESAPAAPAAAQSDADLWSVLENGIRDISGEVRNSLDFHRSQEGGGEVSHVVMSGCAQDIPGFAAALQSSLGVEVRCQEVGVADKSLGNTVSLHRLAVATGLAAAEAVQ
jgi:type IV pilus assembly protein PilM